MSPDNPTPPAGDQAERIELNGGWHFVPACARPDLMALYGPKEFQGFWSVTDARAFAAALSASPSPQASALPVGWQPIATAPKDGTRVLVSRFGSDYHVIAAHAQHAGYKGHPWREGFSGGRVTLSEPTHWMPLPAAPGAASPKPPAAAGERLPQTVTPAMTEAAVRAFNLPPTSITLGDDGGFDLAPLLDKLMPASIQAALDASTPRQARPSREQVAEALWTGGIADDRGQSDVPLCDLEPDDAVWSAADAVLALPGFDVPSAAGHSTKDRT